MDSFHQDSDSLDMQTLEAFCSAFLYGGYVVVFVAFILARKKSKGKGKHREPVTFIASSLFVLVSGHLSTVLTDALLTDEARSIEIQRASMFLYRAIDLVGQSILLWRTSIIWDASSWIFAPLMSLLTVSTSFGFITLGMSIANFRLESFVPELIAGILLFSTPLICTGLFLGRYFYLRDKDYHFTWRDFTFLVVESGVLYTILEITTFVVTYLNLPGYSIVDDATAIVYAILSTLTLTLVASRKSPAALRRNQNANRCSTVTSWRAENFSLPPRAYDKRKSRDFTMDFRDCRPISPAEIRISTTVERKTDDEKMTGIAF